MKRILPLLILLLLALPAGAVNLYVDGTIDPSPATHSHTYDVAARTIGAGAEIGYAAIQSAAAECAAGDTIYVRAGTYSPTTRIQFASKTGTGPLAKITLRNYGTEAVIIDAAGSPSGTDVGLIHVSLSSYVVIQGLRVTTYAQDGIYYHTSPNGEIINCTVDTIQRWGILIHLSNSTTISGCTVYDCGLSGNSTCAICLRGSSYCTVTGNEMYGSTTGLQVVWYATAPGTQANFNTISYNLAHDNDVLPENADGIAFSTHTYDNTAIGNICYGNYDDGLDTSTQGGSGDSRRNHFIDNIAFNNGDGAGLGDGNGIKFSTGAGGQHFIIGNIAFDNERAGYDMDQEAGFPANLIANNLAYANGSALSDSSANSRTGFALDSSQNNTILYNNISAENLTTDLYQSGDAIATSDYNYWADGGFPAEDTAGGHSLSDAASDLDFNEPDLVVDTTFAEGLTIAEKMEYIRHQVQDKFRLLTTSDCINAGTPVTGSGRFWNVTPDMGPYESDTGKRYFFGRYVP